MNVWFSLKSYCASLPFLSFLLINPIVLCHIYLRSIQSPRQIEEAAFGGEQIFLFAFCGNLLFSSQNGSLSWVAEDKVATYSEIMSAGYQQLTSGWFYTEGFQVSENRKQFNSLSHHNTYHLLIDRVLCYRDWAKHFILLVGLAVKMTALKALILLLKME